MTDIIAMKPIGRIETPFQTQEDLKFPPFDPRAPYHDPGVRGTVRLFEEYAEGVADIKPGTYAMLIFYFDRSDGYSLTTKSPRYDEPVGIFSTRSPNRPNGIGISVVEFLSVGGGILTFRGVDMLDGTPLLDIKPYSGEIPGAISEGGPGGKPGGGLKEIPRG